MSLKYMLKSLEGLSADIAALYTQQADGTYVLGVDGVVPKEKLDEFRQNNVQLMKQLEPFKDIDPSKHAEAMAALRKIQEKQLIDAGEIDKVVNLRVGEMKSTYESQVATLQQQNTLATRQLETLLIDSAVRDAAMKSGVQATAVEDVLLRAKSTFKIQDGAAVPVDPKGQVVYGKDGTTPMSVEDWTAGLKKQAPHLFQPSQGSGAAGSTGVVGDPSKMSSTAKITSGLASIGM